MIDLEYYKTVVNTQNDSEILKAELKDLIHDIETDSTYRAIVGVITGKDEYYD